MRLASSSRIIRQRLEFEYTLRIYVASIAGTVSSTGTVPQTSASRSPRRRGRRGASSRRLPSARTQHCTNPVWRCDIRTRRCLLAKGCEEVESTHHEQRRNGVSHATVNARDAEEKEAEDAGSRVQVFRIPPEPGQNVGHQQHEFIMVRKVYTYIRIFFVKQSHSWCVVQRNDSVIRCPQSSSAPGERDADGPPPRSPRRSSRDARAAPNLGAPKTSAP